VFPDSNRNSIKIYLAPEVINYDENPRFLKMVLYIEKAINRKTNENKALH